MRASRRRRPAASPTSDAVRQESYPHPYPTGWYRLSDSASLRPGGLRYIECLGRQLVLWRSEDGAPHVMHAFCPHLGANLSYGRVRGDCIECPFHRWQFTGDGRAAHVPYSDHIPEGVLTGPFPVQEVHGQVFVHHSCGGGQANGVEPPRYPVPNIPEVDAGTFAFRGAHDAGRVRMHILEFAENSVDRAHFQPVHGHMRIPWTQFPVPGVRIEHEADWRVDGTVPWKMYFFDKAVLRILGRRVERAGASARIAFFGPGGPLEQQVNFRSFADRRLPRLLVWYVVGNWISQWARDIQIWENNIYREHPRLCRDDGPVFRLRQWYRQFLPDSTPATEATEELRRADVK